ncbi:methyltransferase domain-containing protein [Candidatus Uhrbacteria bacterium]|nr:methyltransferase domain-containing protein [Candidatus Uhrbacteria bacterium]
MKHFLVYGTHPEISLAETRAVLGDIQPVMADSVAIFETEAWDSADLQNRLAGTVKLGDIIDERTLDVLDDGKLLADHIEARPRAERILFSLTIVGGSNKDRQALKHLPIRLKRELQERGKSVRWVTGDNGILAPAAISKMGLTTDGYDFVIAIHGDTVSIGLTTQVQNIDAWSLRDFGRPFRDAKTGMLPPKLARMMVNLAAPTSTLLDPFCGSGTVIMEAALLHKDLQLVGSDIDARQIKGAQENTEWLMAKELIRRADADRISWKICPVQEIAAHVTGKEFDAIVTEGYLGAPLSGNEPAVVLEKEKQEIEELWAEALPILSKLQPAGGRLVAVWPDLVGSHGTFSVSPIQAAEKAGYSMIGKPLTYARPDQHIRRKIVILMKK